eukprot:256156_1
MDYIMGNRLWIFVVFTTFFVQTQQLLKGCECSAEDLDVNQRAKLDQSIINQIQKIKEVMGSSEGNKIISAVDKTPKDYIDDDRPAVNTLAKLILSRKTQHIALSDLHMQIEELQTKINKLQLQIDKLENRNWIHVGNLN